MLNSDELKRLQACELLIAKEIKRICEINNIKYFMIAGSTLGAIRHQGFIPWDDDMDFGMERAEYERFCRVCKKDLHTEFELQTWDTDAEYPFSFGKIRLKGTHIKEKFSCSGNAHDGIFVDIFPFDNIPDNPKKQNSQKRAYYFYKRALWIKKGYGINIKEQSFKQSIKYNLFKTICFLIPYNCLKNRFSSIMQKYNQISTKQLTIDGAYSFERNSIKREWIERIIEYPFENDVFPSFQDYDLVLRNMYGDYMTLPNINSRHNHDILEVDFGIYSFL